MEFWENISKKNAHPQKEEEKLKENKNKIQIQEIPKQNKA